MEHCTILKKAQKTERETARRAEGKMKEEKGQLAPPCFSAFIFVPQTGKLSNQMMEILKRLSGNYDFTKV